MPRPIFSPAHLDPSVALVLGGPPKLPVAASLSKALAKLLQEPYEDTVNRFDADPFNILIVGDGYTSSEADTQAFNAHCNALLKPFKNPNPLDIPSWLVNILGLATRNTGLVIRDLTFYTHAEDSDYSGIDGQQRDTMFGMHYARHPWLADTGSRGSLLSGAELYERTNAVRRHVLQVHDLPIHRVLILANSTVRAAGHIGGALLVPGGYTHGTGSFGLFQHEFGHAIGLGDEYWADQGPDAAPNDTTLDAADPMSVKDYPYPNVSWHAHGRTAPGGGTKAPGWPQAGDDGDRPGDRRGSIYNPLAYRPAQTCIMRDADQTEFCPVCEQHFTDFFTLRTGQRQYPFFMPRIKHRDELNFKIS